MTIRAAADGSALGNPGPAGWAWYVDDRCWAAGGWKHATNNQAELTAVLQFFRATAHLSDDLLILCDSQYVINCVTKWMPGWKKKGWRKADGQPVMNLDLLKEIDEAIVGRKYRFEWVKGHANHPLNEAADTRARAVSEAFQRGAAIPSGPGLVLAAGHSAGDESAGPADTQFAVTNKVTTTGSASATASDVQAPVAEQMSLFEMSGMGAGESEQKTPDRDNPDQADAVSLTLTLTDAQFDRLKTRARTRGVTPEALLRDLI